VTAPRLAAAVALAAVVVQLPIYDRWISLLDEGYLLALADDINRGRVLYRDVYVDAPFPGAFYLLAAWFRLAGTSVWSSRILELVVFALFAALVVGIARTVVSRGWAAGLAIVLLCYRLWAFPHWHVLSYSSLASTALAAGVALVGAHVRSGAAGTLVAAGLLVGVGLLCKQDYGIGVGGALGLFLLARPWLGGPAGLATPARFAAGVAAVVGPALAALAAAGGLGGLVRQAILVPLSGAMSFGYLQLPPLRPLVHQDPTLRDAMPHYLPSILATLRWEEIAVSRLYRETAVWDVALKMLYYAPLAAWAAAALAWGTATLVRARRGAVALADQRRLLLLAWAGGFLLAFNRPRDWVHLMMIYPPALVIGTVLLSDLLGRAPRALRAVAGTGLGVAVVALAVVSLSLGADLRRRMDWPLTMPRGGVHADARHGPIIEDVLAWIAREAPADAPVPVYPVQPMLGFLAGRESAGGFHVIWPVQGPERDARIIADLEARHVDTVVYSLSQYAHLGRVESNAPHLYEYLVRHYEIAEVFSREIVGPLVCGLRRRGPPPPGVLLWDLAPQGDLAPVRWPFAEVMAQPVGTPGAPVPLEVEVRVPDDGTRLALHYGVNPDRWLWLAAGPFTFEATATAADGTARVLLRATLDPARRLEDRRWVPATLDLGATPGRLRLRFTVTAPAAPPEAGDVAGWAEPRLGG
jgi:hypothetical protein